MHMEKQEEIKNQDRLQDKISVLETIEINCDEGMTRIYSAGISTFFATSQIRFDDVVSLISA